MFDQLTDRLGAVFKKLRSRGKLHPKQVDSALGDIRDALLDADVAVEVAEDLIQRVRVRAQSEEVMRSLTPAQQVVKVVRDELTSTLGGEHHPFVLPNASPVVVMLAGVQGSGKTTTCSKLALRLKEKGHRPLLVAADLRRPAAIEQLFTLGEEIGVPVVSDGRDPAKVAHAGGLHQVMPVGIFQPAGGGDGGLDLWRCMAREYSEEFLGTAEEYGPGFSHDAWPFFQALEEARRDGRLSVYCLGLGVDPLTFATDLLTVAVFAADTFDTLFAGLVRENDEGLVSMAPFTGRPREPMQPAGAAVLELAWRHRALLL